MTKLNLLLLVALIASSVYLVRVSHDSRQLFAQLDRARTDARLLDSEFERLKSEQQSQATPLRVEKAAVQRLGMRPATPAVMRQVTYPDAASSASLAASTSSEPRKP